MPFSLTSGADPKRISHELMSANDLEGPRYGKFLSCCSFAVQRGYAWVWIDTCCIDKNKKSSAELSEVINSMYHWYQNAAECYAYLSDVPVVSEAGGLSQQPCRGNEPGPHATQL